MHNLTVWPLSITALPFRRIGFLARHANRSKFLLISREGIKWAFFSFLCLLSCRMSLRFRVNYLFIRYPLAWRIYILRYWIYREVQLDSTPEIKVFNTLSERCHIRNRKGSIKQHIKYFNFRSKDQLDHPAQ